MSALPSKLDLVILGGGLAGLSAGNRARQLGLSVAIVEQGDGPQYPCNSRFSGGILHLAFRNVKDPPSTIVEAMLQANGGYGDVALITQLANTSARAVDWLQAEGTQFIRMNDVVWQQWMFAPPRPLAPGLDWNGRGPDVTLRRLYDNFVGRGGVVLHRAKGIELVSDARACRGLVIEVDGARRTLASDAVIIADGGFQANLELLRNITPSPSKLLQRGAGNARGAGMRMAQSLGAGVSDLSTFYGHLQSQDALTNPKLWPYPQLDELATSGIVVTREGERFTDEGLGGVNIANRIAHRDDPLDCFVVFDAQIWDTSGKGARIPANPHLVDGGARFIRAGTIAALADAMGVPPERLQRTVDAYNVVVAAANFESLSPSRSTHKYKPMPIMTAPFHALPIVVGITHTTGGLLIDEHARVRRSDGATIDGLYAAGSATGGIEGGPDAGYVGGLMKALVFGIVAAEDMAARKPVVAGTAQSPSGMSPPAVARGSSLAGPVAPVAPVASVAGRVPEMSAQKRYPAVKWLVKYGQSLATGLAVFTLFGALALFATGNWVWGVVALAASPLVYVLIKSYTELVTLMSDMLLPK